MLDTDVVNVCIQLLGALVSLWLWAPLGDFCPQTSFWPLSANSWLYMSLVGGLMNTRRRRRRREHSTFSASSV